MARTITTQTLIDAPADVVWRELTDFPSFPQWNPFMVRAEGDLRPGEHLKIRLKLGRFLFSTFKPRVTKVEPGRALGWHATTGAPGLFDVDRSFRLEPEDGRVRFTQSETCTGLLGPLMWAAGLEKKLYRGYDALNEALRARAERPAAARS